MDVIDQIKKKMDSALDHLRSELKTLRTGRANPGIVENVSIEVYGTHMRLKDMASISVPDAKQLLIAPFDTKNTHAIAKGIESANLNVRVIVDGNAVRIKVPEMDSTVRQNMVKLARKKCEDAKIAIRNIRREGNETVKKQKSTSEITEDVVKKLEKSIQEMTDKFCKNADEVTAEKEKEILTV